MCVTRHVENTFHLLFSALYAKVNVFQALINKQFSNASYFLVESIYTIDNSKKLEPFQISQNNSFSYNLYFSHSLELTHPILYLPGDR